MRRFRWPALAALLVALPADALAEARVSFGAGSAVPTGTGEHRRFGAGASLAYGFAISPWWIAGAKVRRYHYGNLDPTATAAGGFARWRPGDPGRVSPFVSMSVGLGFYTGCVRAEECNGIGVATSAEAGLSIPLGDTLRLETAFEASAQSGMPAGAGWLVMPTLQAGIAF